MKEEKQNLVIFEGDELLIRVLRDYFSENYNLNFLEFLKHLLKSSVSGLFRLRLKSIFSVF